MITVVHGEDAFSADQEVERLIDTLVEPSWRQTNLSVFEGTAPVSDIVAAARSASFFGNRLVVVKNCPWFNPVSRKGADDGEAPEPASDGPAVVALLEAGLPDGCNLVLVVSRKIHSGMTTSRAAISASKAGRARIVEFAGPDPFRKDPSYEWVARRARDLGGAIAPEAAEFLVDRLGQDRYLLDQELRKLTSYASGRPVERKDVALLSPPGEADVFALVEAIVQRRTAEAIVTLRGLILSDHPLKILSTMASSLKAYLHEKALADRRRSIDEIAAVVKRKPGRVRRDLDLVRRWSPEQLQSALSTLVEAEGDLKRSSGSDRLVMERLIVQLVSL